MKNRKRVRRLSPEKNVRSAVREYVAHPERRPLILPKLREFRLALGQTRYDDVVNHACNEIVHELGHPPAVEFPGELWFETGTRLAATGGFNPNCDDTDTKLIL